MAIFTVRSGSMYEIDKMIRRLQSAAKRNGWPLPTLKPLTSVYATAQYQSVVDVEIEAPVFEMDGWRVVGEWASTGRFIEYTKTKHAGEFVGGNFACQHCGKLRKRNGLFALLHDSGEKRLVGSSCIDEFTGVLNAERHAMFLQKLFALAESIQDAQKLNIVQRAQIIPTPIVCIVTCAAIRNFGYAGSSDANSTYKRVLQYLEQGSFPGLEVADEDVEVANKIVSKVGGENSFVFAAAMPMTVLQIKQKVAELEQAEKPSEWVGKLGDKVSLTVKFLECRKLVGGQWDSWLYKGRTAANEAIVVFSSKELPVVINTDTKIAGNVKKHDDYKGAKSTVLNYVKIL